MSTQNGTEDHDKLEQNWTPEVEADRDAPEFSSELTLDADHHTPEEAGYGYGV